MENAGRPIVVPWDFTEEAKYAFMYAVNLSKISNNEIVLLHLAKEENELHGKEEELKTAIEDLKKEFGKESRYVLKSGSIYSVIGQVAHDEKAELIIMGTHGRKGSQKVFGSKALKVIVSSRTPFMVVQDKPIKDKPQTILMPVDFKKENKEKAAWIFNFSTKFDAKITIFKSHPKDRGFKNKLKSNMTYIQEYLRLRDIEYDVVASEGKKSFKEEIVDYAKEKEFDLIMVMATRDIKTIDYLFGAPEQFILSNEHNIPVLCVNPKPRKVAHGFRASGG